MGCFDVYCAHCDGPFSVAAAGAEKERYLWMEEITQTMPGAAPAPRAVYYDGYGRFYRGDVQLRPPVVHARCETRDPQTFGRYIRWARGQFFDWDAFLSRA